VGSNIIKVRNKQMLIEAKSVPMSIVDPWTLYLYAMRSPATKEKYLMRLGKFLNFLNLQGTLEDKGSLQRRGRMIIYGPLTASLNFCTLRRNDLTGKK
jgi:hypothetical protein